MRIKQLILCLSASALAVLSVAAQAEKPQLQGYFSQSVIYSPDNVYFGEKGVNADYRELGLNLSWNINDQMRVAGQVLSRVVGGLDSGKPVLDFLLLDYNFLAREGISAGVRIGRFKNHYGFYNTARDVPHGRPGVSVPRSVYFESLRSSILSSDGINLYTNISNDLADISIDAFAGEAHFNNDAIEYQMFQVDMPGKFEDVDGVGLMTTVSPAAIPGLTLAASYLDISTDYVDAPTFTANEIPAALNDLVTNPSSFPDYITSITIDAQLYMLSMQYNWNAWLFTSEYLSLDLELADTTVLGMSIPMGSFRDEYVLNGYYGQLEWLASEKLSVYGRYEELYYDKDDKNGERYAQSNGGSPLTQFNKALTIGARWYLTEDISITGEYSANEGAGFTNGQSNIDVLELKKHWDLFVVQFAYHF